jgi:hypothetical protein
MANLETFSIENLPIYMESYLNLDIDISASLTAVDDYNRRNTERYNEWVRRYNATGLPGGGPGGPGPTHFVAGDGNTNDPGPAAPAAIAYPFRIPRVANRRIGSLLYSISSPATKDEIKQYKDDGRRVLQILKRRCRPYTLTHTATIRQQLERIAINDTRDPTLTIQKIVKLGQDLRALYPTGYEDAQIAGDIINALGSRYQQLSVQFDSDVKVNSVSISDLTQRIVNFYEKYIQGSSSAGTASGGANKSNKSAAGNGNATPQTGGNRGSTEEFPSVKTLRNRARKARRRAAKAQKVAEAARAAAKAGSASGSGNGNKPDKPSAGSTNGTGRVRGRGSGAGNSGSGGGAPGSGGGGSGSGGGDKQPPRCILCDDDSRHKFKADSP